MFLCFYWYGSNSGKAIHLELFSGAGSDYECWEVIENWYQWGRVVIAFEDPTWNATGSLDLSQITRITISITDASLGQTAYLDRTITDRGYKLTALSLEENSDAVAFFTDKWVSGAYKQAVSTIGLVRRWAVDCVEKDQIWVNSAANLLKAHQKDGTTLVFTVLEKNLYAIAVDVKILRISVHYADIGVANVRHFSVELQEV